MPPIREQERELQNRPQRANENENDSSDVDQESREDDEVKEQDDAHNDEVDERYQAIIHHHSYSQVMLDVNRCAGRLEHIRQVYFHRTDDDNEPPEDLTEELRNFAEEESELEGKGEKLSSYRGNFETNSSCHLDTEDLKHNQHELKRKLAELIVKLLIKNPDLHYYQGFHDVCLTYMTILGDVEAYNRLDKLIDSHFKVFMQPTMNETQDFLALIPIIIGLHDPKLQDFLQKAEVGTIFALSWVITWFSHVIPSECDVERIFRFLEEQDPHMVLYLCAEIVMLKRDELLRLEPEMSTVHHFLCQVPRKEKLPIESLLSKATKAYSRWSPEILRQRLDSYRRAKLQLHNYNILATFAQRWAPNLANVVTTNKRTAIVVFLLASAMALQFDRWLR